MTRAKSWLAKAEALAVTLVVLLGPVVPMTRASALSVGPNNPATQADNTTSGVGTVAWSSVTNIGAQDSTFATQSLSSGAVGHYAMATNYGFAIPSNGIIDGVTATVWRKVSSTSSKAQVQDNAVRLVLAGAVQTTDRSTTTAWTATNTAATYGSATDLWGATLAPSDVNNTGFGIAFSAKNVKLSGSGSSLTANLDWIGVMVYYHLPASFGQSAYRWFNNPASAGVTPTTFAKAYGGANSDGINTGSAEVATSDGGYVITGNTYSYNDSTNGDLFIAKYDYSGVLTWFKTWGGTGRDTGQAVIQTADGGYAVTGYTTSYGTANEDVVLLKFASDGTLSWAKTWGGSGSDYGYSLTEVTGGGYVVAGYTSSSSLGAEVNGDTFLIKFDANGTALWNTIWGGNNTEYARSVIQTSDGGFLVAGSTLTYGTSGSYDNLLLKFDSNGGYSWNKVWGTASSEQLFKIIQTSDGGYAAAGYTNGFGGGRFERPVAAYCADIWYGTGRPLSCRASDRWRGFKLAFCFPEFSSATVPASAAKWCWLG